MKLIIVTHEVSLHDGQGRVNLEVIRAALRAGHTVTLLASKLDSTVLADEDTTHFSVVLFNESRLPGKLFKYQVFAIQTGAWLWRNRQPGDVVVVNGFITWARGDINAVHFVHDGYFKSGYFPYRISASLHNSYQSVFTALNRMWEKWAFRRAQTLVAVSGKVARELEAVGIPAERIVEIPNGVDTDEFKPRGTGPDERGHFGLPDHSFLILFAGDLRLSRKNVDTVLRALAHCPEQVSLAIAGDERGSPCLATVKQLKLGDRVHFVGKTSEMHKLMRAVDAFVFPSCYEPFGLVVLEAMASGLPVVTAQSTGAAGLVEEAGGFVMGNPLDDKQLAGFIGQLANDRARASDMGRRAREVASSLSWTEVGQRYLDVFERHELQAAAGVLLRPLTARHSYPDVKTHAKREEPESHGRA